MRLTADSVLSSRWHTSGCSSSQTATPHSSLAPRTSAVLAAACLPCVCSAQLRVDNCIASLRASLLRDTRVTLDPVVSCHRLLPRSHIPLRPCPLGCIPQPQRPSWPNCPQHLHQLCRSSPSPTNCGMATVTIHVRCCPASPSCRLPHASFTYSETCSPTTKAFFRPNIHTLCSTCIFPVARSGRIDPLASLVPLLHLSCCGRQELAIHSSSSLDHFLRWVELAVSPRTHHSTPSDHALVAALHAAAPVGQPGHALCCPSVLPFVSHSLSCSLPIALALVCVFQ